MLGQQKLFYTFLFLFLFVAAVDLLNLDRHAYKFICDMLMPITGGPCPPYYDLPIWNVYLSLAILAALHSLHSEVRITNRHLSSK